LPSSGESAVNPSGAAATIRFNDEHGLGESSAFARYGVRLASNATASVLVNSVLIFIAARVLESG
jgi:hypothetical protein